MISVGEDNTYGHPSPEALAIYEGVGARVYRTDLNGTVVVSVESDGTYRVDAKASSTESAAPSEEDEPSGTSSLTYDPSGPDRACVGFATQAEAQAFYEAAGGPEQDPHRLDGEGDGIVCESN